MKKTSLLILGLALGFMLAAGPIPASAQMTLKSDTLSYKVGQTTKTLPLDASQAAAKVENSDLVFITLTDPEVLTELGKRPGLFFFDKNGALAAEVAGNERFDPEMCAGASLSPGGRTMALDNGTWVVRSWSFFSFPDFTPLGPADEPFISYLSQGEGRDLAWVDDRTVVLTDLSATLIARPCPADPCEPSDVVLHRLDAWASETLAKGDELCDYRFLSLSGRTATVEKTCVKKLDDWADEDGSAKRLVTREQVAVPAGK